MERRKKAAMTLAVFMAAGVIPSVSRSAEPGVYALEEIVVTATKTENRVQDVSEATEVITQNDFKKLGAQDIRSALKLAANVEVGEAGMTGNQVMIRGMASSHTLILVDGRRVAGEDTSETMNAYELNRLSLSNVERIEIVRGNSSALYGSDALGGVINIITKRPEEAGLVIGANTGAREMNNYYHYDFGQIGKFNGAIDANFQKIREFSWRGGDRTALYGPRQNFSFSGEYKIRENRALGMNLDWMKDHMRMKYADADFMRWPTARDKYQTIDSERKGASLDYRVKTNASDFMVRTYFNRLEKDNDTYNRVQRTGETFSMRGMVIGVTKETGRHELFDYDRARYDTFVIEARDTTRIAKNHRLTVGGDYRYLTYEGTRLNAGDKAGQTSQADLKRPAEREMNFAAGYIQDEWTPSEKWIITPSIRYDYSDKFGSNTAPKIGATYKIRENLRFKANYGRGFRAPTLSELYMYFDGQSMSGQPINFYITGNPELKPEKSLGYDFTLEGETGNLSARVSYFHNKVDNLIAAKSVGGLPYTLYRYENVDAAKLEGVETELGLRLGGRWTMKGTWNTLDAVDETDGSRLENRGRHYGTVQMLYDDKKENGLSGVIWYQFMQDYRYDNADYSYHTWNLSVNKKWNEHLTTFFGLDNILDDDVPDICVAGRTWRTGAEWKF